MDYDDLKKNETSQKLPTAAESQDCPSFLEELNSVQQKAALTTEGPLLIIAGAGSGKTRVLTYRVAYLLEMGVHPSNILAITFTNKAAGEMKTRIAAVAKEHQAKRVWAGTFHSIFARLLRSEADLIGYTPTFSIYDTDDSLSLLRGAMQSLSISQQQISPQSVRSRISSAKNQMISATQYGMQASNLSERLTAKIYPEYEKRLRINNAMDFDDLLINIIHLFRQNDEVLKKYQQQFQYILVDEYQDTNRAQYLAVQLLAGSHNNLCVVGDDAQSIYRWRGADIRNILDFQTDYPNGEILRLEQNYRSTKTILSAANAVIKHNRRQLPKTIWTENPDGEKIPVLEADNEREESELIVRAITSEQKKHGYANKSFAVLYRTNAQSQPLEDAFRRSNIPYVIVGGMSFYKRKEVKDAIAYLRLLVNANDGESLLRTINMPSRGVGSTSLQHLQQYAGENGITLFEAFKQASKISLLTKRASAAAATFAEFIERFQDIKESLPPAELAHNFLEASGLLRLYRDDGSDEALDRLHNIEQIISNIAEFSDLEEQPSLELFLQQISLVSDTDETDTSQDRVSLMTLHAAKGLEFPVVFISGMEQGLFPLGKADNSMEEEEEERRLFYVGITRAEKKLYISYADRRYKFGRLEFSVPSRFLREIHSDLLEKKQSKYDSIHRRQIPEKSVDDIYFHDIADQEETVRLRVGARVKHPMFGEGIVRSVSGESENSQATVAFKSVGLKKLMLAYANLELVV